MDTDNSRKQNFANMSINDTMADKSPFPTIFHSILCEEDEKGGWRAISAGMMRDLL
jgi:hypothetical protein